jgi:hypothetical protein
LNRVREVVARKEVEKKKSRKEKAIKRSRLGKLK